LVLIRPVRLQVFSSSIGVPLNQQHGFVLSQNGVQLQTGQFRIGDLTDSIKAD
jgi:hypothetical protein